MAAQKQTHQRLGVLRVQKGYITEGLLASALSEALGIALVKLEVAPEVVVGQPLCPEARRSGLKEDLAFLFGSPVEDEAVEKLEKKFWALMRVLARKGLVTKDDFARELDVSDG